MKPDTIDLKLLAALDRNARSTETELAKALGTSKQVVGYRLKRLEQAGIITQYYAILNTGQLGYDSYYVYLQLSGINKEKEHALLAAIQQLPYVAWLVTGVGRWDAVVLVCAESVRRFDEQLEGINRLCGSHLHEQTHSTLVSAEHISYKFLREEAGASVKVTPRTHTRTLDDTDRKILRLLDQHARLPITEIAEKTKIPVHTVHYHFKQLLKEKIIDGFKPKISVGKLGYQWHLLLIEFQNVSAKRKQEFIRFCKATKNVYYVTNCVGQYNLMLDIHVQSPEEFRDVLFTLKDTFADVIKRYESMVVFEELKISYIPEEL